MTEQRKECLDTLLRVRGIMVAGWAQGLPLDHTGKPSSNHRHWVKGPRCLGLCVLDQSDTIYTAQDCFKALGFKNTLDTGFWNDKPERKLQEVLDRIDEAISLVDKD